MKRVCRRMLAMLLIVIGVYGGYPSPAIFTTVAPHVDHYRGQSMGAV